MVNASYSCVMCWTAADFGGATEWWLTTLDGTTTQVADSEYFAEHRLTEPIPVAWLAGGDRVIFTARFADSVNVWQVPISTKTWKLTSAPERLTFGSGLEARPSIAALAGGSARLVFAALVENINIWALPLDANQGRASGEISRLTQTVASDTNPALTLDGRRLFFTSNRAGNRDIWVKDLAGGKETNLTNSPVNEWRPTITADGSKVAYAMMEPPSRSIYVLTVAEGVQGAPQPGVAQKISIPGYCGYPWSWSSDGRKLLYNCPANGSRASLRCGIRRDDAGVGSAVLPGSLRSGRSLDCLWPELPQRAGAGFHRAGRSHDIIGKGLGRSYGSRRLCLLSPVGPGWKLDLSGLHARRVSLHLGAASGPCHEAPRGLASSHLSLPWFPAQLAQRRSEPAGNLGGAGQDSLPAGRDHRQPLDDDAGRRALNK